MLRSLFSGISGLRSHQTMMDVTGNNIANVNTAGFKSSQTVFQDTLSQLLRGAGAPQGGAGGTNPSQVGLGVRLAGVTTNFGQGAAQTTGRSTDLMIQGDGFFVVRSGAESLYTRAGAFSFDAGGRLTTPEGSVVQGWAAGPNGVINSNGPVGDIVLPVGQVLAPKATANVEVGGNLPADAPDAPVAARVPVSIKVFDAEGKELTLGITFTKTPTGWDLTQATPGAFATTPLSFGPGPNPASVSYTIGTQVITVDLRGMTGYAGESSAGASSQDGAGMGSLQSFTMSPDGTLVGIFSNGLKQNLAQVALSNFNNPAGLEKVGGSMYRTTVNSGASQLGAAGSAGRGLLSAGTVEMSNVDLAQEFTNLIVAQRGFQANSRVITTSDQILDDLVNLKR
jgi:flagellar hook protein FlgE